MQKVRPPRPDRLHPTTSARGGANSPNPETAESQPPFTCEPTKKTRDMCRRRVLNYTTSPPPPPPAVLGVLGVLGMFRPSVCAPLDFFHPHHHRRGKFAAFEAKFRSYEDNFTFEAKFVTFSSLLLFSLMTAD